MNAELPTPTVWFFSLAILLNCFSLLFDKTSILNIVVAMTLLLFKGRWLMVWTVKNQNTFKQVQSCWMRVRRSWEWRLFLS